MKKVLAVSGIAALLAGCGSSYQWDEVTTSKGSKGKPTAIYVDKKTKEPVSGTIIWKEGDTLISEFKVKNGKVRPDDQVMMTERKLPEEFINQRGNGVTEEFKTWCRPLLGSPLPKLMDLRG